jgi:hypothetical protein
VAGRSFPGLPVGYPRSRTRDKEHDVCNEPIPLTVLELNIPRPVDGWEAALRRRGVAIERDSAGFKAVARSVARELVSEHEEEQKRLARHRQEVEARMIAADAARLAQISKGIPAVAGVRGAELLLALAADERPQRETVLDHALQRRDGPVYHSIEGTATAGGAS